MIEVGVFSGKVLIVLFFIVALVLLVLFLVNRANHRQDLTINSIHKHLENLSYVLKDSTLGEEELKKERKNRKEKKKALKEKTPKETEKNIFVLDFKGDVKANQVDSLREEITSILQIATPKDEVVLRLESPGGEVHSYGLAASQLLRLKTHQIPLTICVDKMAASGGYLMACVADKIIGAPFSVFGSIGVVAQFPNIYHLLKKNDIDYKEYTAGEFKRTVGPLAEITPKGEKRFLEKLESIHALFKKWVGTYRPLLNMEKVSTGEYWYGEEAKSLGLIDEISTSDDYLLKLFQEKKPIYEIKYKRKKFLSERMSEFLAQSSSRVLEKVVQTFESRYFF